MKLTEVVAVWDLLPNNRDAYDCPTQESENSLCFEDFVNAVQKVVGLKNDIPALGGYEE